MALQDQIARLQRLVAKGGPRAAAQQAKLDELLAKQAPTLGGRPEAVTTARAPEDKNPTVPLPPGSQTQLITPQEQFGAPAPTVPTPAQPVVDIQVPENATQPAEVRASGTGQGRVLVDPVSGKTFDVESARGQAIINEFGTTKPTSELTPEDTQQKIKDIALKQAKGEQLTDEEIKFLIDQQFATTAPADLSPLQDTIQSQITDAEAAKTAEAAKLKANRGELLSEQEKLLQKQSLREQGIIQQGANLSIQAGQSNFAFSGFGRSSDALASAQQIQEAANSQILATQQASDLQAQLFQQQLQQADAETLQGMQDGINELQQQSKDLEIQQATLVTEANANAGVTALEAIDNIAQILPQSSQEKVDVDTSKIVGYLSDAYGNPLAVDEFGEPLPLPKDEEAPDFETYTDEYTGQTYFFDPTDPLGTWAPAPGNNQTYTSNAGFPISSPSSNSDKVENVTDNVSDEMRQVADNCVFFARNIVGSIPTGAVSVAGRQEGIKEAEAAGFGGTNMDFVQVGDAIHTTEGPVGHTAVVIGVEGDELILLEANYQSGQITSGRRINKNDPVVMGWMRDTGTVAENQPGEGANPGIQTYISDPSTYQIEFDPSDEVNFEQYAEKGSLPEFSGPPIEQDRQKAEFISKYNTWSEQKGETARFTPEWYATEEGVTATENEFKLEDKFTSEGLYKNYQTLEGQLGKMLSLKEEIVNADGSIDSEGGRNFVDQALITIFNKINDPTSVVRESEFARSAEGLAALESLDAKYQSLLVGGVLNDAARLELLNVAETMFDSEQAAYVSLVDRWSTRASDIGANPEHVVTQPIVFTAPPTTEVNDYLDQWLKDNITNDTQTSQAPTSNWFGSTITF